MMERKVEADKSLKSEIRVYIYLVLLYLQLFVGGCMSYLRYVCVFAHSGVQHILRCACVLFFSINC
jgi:hypothetical protein